MKVALIDNMNNNFFALARYFHDLGVEADLFLIPNRDQIHFDPQHDTWQNLYTCSWIKEFPLSYHWSNYIRPNLSAVKDALSAYDKLIVCGYAVGLLCKASLRTDLFIPYGGDLYNLPFPKKYKVRTGMTRYFHLLTIYRRARFQAQGIASARNIISNTNWKTAQNSIERLGCKALNLPRVMVYKESPPKSVITQYEWLTKYDFVVFSPTRHLWKTNADPLPDFEIHGGMKRNDCLIRAFKHFVDEKICVNSLLLLCEYGADVQHSKQLIRELNLDSYVKWLPLLSRREIAVIMMKAHCVADQFRIGMSATSAGTTNEALAYGTPIITNADGALAVKDDPYFGCPVLQALTQDEVFAHLVALATDIKNCKAIGVAGSRWFDEHLGVGLAQKYLELLQP